ncbi:MAG: M48 family metalloprotease [Candidatus Eremiobacteraeota bacterium]|nr:M48 family metalloprotease [Candidatus Eremiobacteraeota bacterium]MBV8366994.1 M48 family metalloprotease [Candidatus Eremiobacteraeota bacterium]
MKNWKRAIAATLLVVLTLTSLPLPAAAVSTQSEIRMGQDEVKHIDAENAIVNDPVLNNWVQGIADNLKRERARPDIDYTFKVIDTDDINAFSLPGGFIYVNFGLLNFVNSDDELAGVMGHEMGHVERRHVVTLPAKEQAINILIGILSVFSVFAYRFGGLLGSAALYKISRQDELQADQYGLLLMTRAGYDPNAMISFMDRLGKEEGAEPDLLAKYFEDHPETPARISHLEGYPQLSKTDTQQTLAQAIHDEDEGRYAYSLGKFNDVLKADPSNDLALLNKGQDELALGSMEQSQNALTQVAQNQQNQAGSQAAQHELAMLAQNAPPKSFTTKNLDPLRAALGTTEINVHNNAQAIDERVKLERADLHAFDQRLENLSYEIPDYSQVEVRPGSRLESVIFDLEHMSKDLNLILSKGEFITDNASDFSKDIFSTLNEMQAPLHAATPTGDALRSFPYYQSLNQQLNQSSNDALAAVSASRGATALGWQTVPALDAYFKKLSRAQSDFGGDIAPSTAAELKPLAAAAISQLDAAADAAEKAHAMYFAAQSRQEAAQLTLLGSTYPQIRYDEFSKAIHARFAIDAPNYNVVQQLGMSSGDVAIASWLAAEERVPVTNVINEQRAANKPFIDLALSKQYAPESLEVMLGLIYEGYAEKPTE